MRNLEEIKTDLKEMQGNFNPKKQTYKIIDEIVNNSLNPEEVLEKLKLIKGTDKYPEDSPSRPDKTLVLQEVFRAGFQLISHDIHLLFP